MRAAHLPQLVLFAPLASVFADAAATGVALLLARQTDGGGLKEVVVQRSPPTVCIFNVLEHGRRWYRSLVFCSDASCCLAHLPIRVAHHAGTPALVCGDALAAAPARPSLVITRTLPEGSEGAGEQTFLYLPCTFPVPSLYLPCNFPVQASRLSCRAG